MTRHERPDSMAPHIAVNFNRRQSSQLLLKLLPAIQLLPTIPPSCPPSSSCPLSSFCPPSCHRARHRAPARNPAILPAIELLPIPLLPAILPAIAVPGLLSFSSHLIVLVEVTRVEEESSSEVGSSGKVGLLESSASRCRGRCCQGGLWVLAIKSGSWACYQEVRHQVVCHQGEFGILEVAASSGDDSAQPYFPEWQGVRQCKIEVYAPLCSNIGLDETTQM